MAGLHGPWLAAVRAGALAPAVGLLLLLASQPPGAAAWDKDGHEAIGMTAMSALEVHAVAQVKHLMGGRDAVDVAAWAHKVNKKFPWTTELHFQRQPGFECHKADLSRCPDNRCLVKALKHFYGRLTGQSLVTINWPEGMKLTDADCLKFLINLIGDLHQPLHFGGGDDLGRNLTVTFRGRKMSLFDMWDREITQATMRDSPGFWWGGWTHVQRTRVEYEQDGERWKKDGVANFDRWADETAKYLCENVYTNPLTGRRLYEAEGSVRIEESLYELWKREMLSKMLVAGARTAIVLNAVLSHRESKGELHGGTAVGGLEGEEEEDARPHKPALGRKGDAAHAAAHSPLGQGVPPVLANMVIFTLVGGAFLRLMRLWQGRDSVVQADRAKRQQQDGGKKT